VNNVDLYKDYTNCIYIVNKTAVADRFVVTSSNTFRAYLQSYLYWLYLLVRMRNGK